MTTQKIKNALKELQLFPPITNQEIKTKYKELSRKYHPDMCSNSNKFQAINEAYKILKHYIDDFRYDFSDDEIERQYAEIKFKKQFGFF